MKRFARYIMTAAAMMLLAVSCRKDEDISGKIIGSWELVSMDGAPVAEELSVWLDFAPDGFDIYQRAEEDVLYRHFSGTWTISGDRLDGIYSDGSAWGCSYSAAISGDELTLTSSGSPAEVTRYRRGTLPQFLR